MPFKPLSIKKFQRYIMSVGWKLEKGKIDWNLYNEHGEFICSIIIAHGKNTTSEVIALSVHKTSRAFKERGLKWPPDQK